MQELQRRRQVHQQRLNDYREKRSRLQGDSRNRPGVEQFRYLTLRRGIRYEQDWISWCDEVLGVFAGKRGK